MALYHFHADLIRRSAGQSVVAAAAYRAGEKLHCDYYGHDADYTRKKGVVLTGILLPSHAPPEYADRETLWNAVEKVEKNKKAQLAYSYDIALQNELTMEENIALVRKYLTEQFVSKGMIVDFAVHAPDPEGGGISNPHVHILCPIRPIDETGKWGAKQHRVYVLDENGNRVLDDAGNYVFNAVPTTDWGEKETLLHWREEWANCVNRAFEEKGLPCRIDHRSYADRGMEETPTVHEGPTVRAMEKKGVQTNVGDLNRWIRSTNAAIQKLRKRIAELLSWLGEVKAELSATQSPKLTDILAAYYGRMLEIYMLTSLAPIPVATLSNREVGQMGQSYLKSLFAVGFQGLLILLCVGIYGVLVQGISTSGDPIGAIWGCVGYTVLLCFMLFKTGSISKSIFGAH